MRVWMYACTHVCMYVCMYVCMIYVFSNLFIQYTCTCACSCVYMYVYVSDCVCMCVWPASSCGYEVTPTASHQQVRVLVVDMQGQRDPGSSLCQ